MATKRNTEDLSTSFENNKNNMNLVKILKITLKNYKIHTKNKHRQQFVYLSYQQRQQNKTSATASARQLKFSLMRSSDLPLTDLDLANHVHPVSISG